MRIFSTAELDLAVIDLIAYFKPKNEPGENNLLLIVVLGQNFSGLLPDISLLAGLVKVID